ncbi:glycosyltransferase [Sphingobium sp. CR28]|uniref:glycosyltransferase n=1 Tax=Sphingobium sp. CR28 TaxID=3400272 RepID=UPI003FEDC2F5
MLEFSRAALDSSLVFLAIMSLLAALLTARAVPAPHKVARPASHEVLELAGAFVLAFAITGVLFGGIVDILPVFILTLGAIAVTGHFVHRLSMPGIITLVVDIATMSISALWASLFIAEADLSPVLEVLAVTGLAGSVVFFGFSFIERIAREAVLSHEIWRLPTGRGETQTHAYAPKVSIQLPCYAEPPEVVKETMDRLAALDYSNFEVLVCDNNTKDERLWRPLEAYCDVLNRKLGVERFRFFHVSPLPGAKAGALNYLMGVMAPDAELIGVIDADYLSRPDFLSRLVPYFADKRIGYIQTPHDYREHEESTYLDSCYWEYMPSNKVDMPGVSEYGGAFTIGTMCLIRAEGLRQAGGWAEWCLTEDSEVSVRLRACGYEGLYFGETFGRGLIPETFDDYKKQRFRWTAGPVQQLRRHWRLFLPSPLAAPMPGWTKLLEVLRCVAPVRTLFALVSGVVGAAAVAIGVATGLADPITVPDVVWPLLFIGAVNWAVRTAHRYRLAGCPTLKGAVRGEIARMSLSYVVLVAAIAGLSKKRLAWRRTPKFALSGNGASMLASIISTTLPETAIGLSFLTAAVAVIVASSSVGLGLALLLALGFAGTGLRFLTAPYMAWLAEVHAREAVKQDALPEVQPAIA